MLQPDYIAVNYFSGLYGQYDNSTGAQPLNASSTTQTPDGGQLPRADSDWLIILPEASKELCKVA